MAEPTVITLKLLINTQAKRVLFAEAGNDFVDFLFRLLSLPVGTVISLLRKQEMVGSLPDLYQSLENLDDSYIQPNQSKDTLLRPVIPVSGFADLLALDDAPCMKYYSCTCNQHGTYVSGDPNIHCPICKKKMTTVVNYVPLPKRQHGSESGFVKGVITYMVTDNLAVTPLSTISSIALLKNFYVKDVNVLEEKVVKFRMVEAVKLLSASMTSKKVLTDVFLDV
ncbi:hypothetical protein OROGR_002603 [Orobanche gracilis]